MSFDYSTAQWVLSIIIGVCLTKVYSTISHHIRHRKDIIFYLPYLLLVANTFIILITTWFASPWSYQMVEGNKLGFLARILSDSTAVIFTLVALPDELIPSKDKLDLKAVYYDSKKSWMVVMIMWGISSSAISIFFGAEEYRIIAIGGIIIGPMIATLMIKFNNDYLHAVFHLFYIVQMMQMIF